MKTAIRPVYDDSFFINQLCSGEPMDVEDIPLTSKLVQGYALEMMESGRTCETKELEELILDRHKKMAGEHRKPPIREHPSQRDSER